MILIQRRMTKSMEIWMQVRVLTATADGGGDPKLSRVLRVHYEMLHIPCKMFA